MAKEIDHTLNAIGGCTCGVWGCRRWRDKFPKQGEEPRCKICLRLLTMKENFDGSYTMWCLNCSML